MKNKSYFLVLGFGTFLILLSPLLARLGSWSEVKRWDAPTPNPLGHSRDLHLSVEQTHSFFDPLGLYHSARFLITDGGYAYVFYFDVPAHPIKPWVDKCEVAWTTDGVAFISPDGLTIKVDRQTVLKQL